MTMKICKILEEGYNVESFINFCLFNLDNVYYTRVNKNEKCIYLFFFKKL